MTSPGLRLAGIGHGIAFRPDANTVLWLPGQDDAFSSTIRDRSGNGNDGTLANTTWVKNSKGLWVLDFNATTSIVTVSDAASIQNIFDGGGTIEAWINLASDGEQSLGNIVNKNWRLRVDSESVGEIRLRFIQDFDGVADGTWTTTTRALPINTCIYVAVSYDSDATTNNPTFVINETEFTVSSGITESVTPVGTRVSDIGTDLGIGNRTTVDRTTDGTIGLVRASDVSRATTVLQGYHQQERGLFGV